MRRRKKTATRGRSLGNREPRRIDHRVEYYDTETEQEEEDLRLQGSEDCLSLTRTFSYLGFARSQAAELV
jgi:hypothetical protein